MLIKRLSILLMALFTCSAAYAAGEADLMVRAAKPGASVSVDRVIQDGKVLVSVSDAAKNPLMGLGLADFSVMQSGRKAQILSVQPMAESQDIPRHIVMVLDNSYSMYERNAIKPLLAGVDSLLRIVRPIDTVYLVVFDNKVTTKVGSRVLRVKTFKSSSKPELQEFVRKAYSTEG